MYYAITDQPIQTDALLKEMLVDTSGAIVTFYGIVRRPSRGRDVLYLEYSAYDSMARSVLEQIGQEVYASMEVDRIVIVHRTGHIEVGATSIFIAVAAPHRQAAFDGCSHIIERIKQILPVWKKEVWEGGEEWIHGA
ncbi:molybdopterin-converting factor subunit 2, MPT synthase [Candidatus Moduliflexus flocculans]|uniref:Molybdopterin-converting factor subunit 2, MPT synthase n=1 Tax=Candidatus Moduliflexus flocculans TaxID=1499966 RepID=A0A081BPQ5_9BACT|nr:molybdopterin-converting factor subunit 2, MPT synthase [Candidatus Moduliflexus flocculans]